MRVEDVMTREVATARVGDSLKDVADQLISRGISGMPVIDEDGRVVGIVSEADVLVKQRRPREPSRGSALARLLSRGQDQDELRLDARTAGEAMTSPAVSAGPMWSIAMAAETMLEKGINRLPVVQHDRLVGIVTRADLVRAFARSDDDLAGEIRELVTFQQALWGEDGDVTVAVEAGEVTLKGSLQRRSQAELLPKVIRSVAGVVSVRADLSWAEDT